VVPARSSAASDEKGFDWRAAFKAGTVIPAHPLALTGDRKLDERYQRALTRYYLAAGAGGVAVGVHTTQFQIRDSKVGLYEPVLALAAEELHHKSMIRIAGICGGTPQAVKEATTARDLNYHAGLLSMASLSSASLPEQIAHVRAVGEILPVVGFYLQTAVGGAHLSAAFWQQFAQVESVVGVKVAPFDRYATQDVMRGIAASSRASEIALYTGNDDHIVLDLISRYQYLDQKLRFVGGLLGHWAVWTLRAVELHRQLRQIAVSGEAISPEWFLRNNEVTDMNAALFDVAHNFRGCIAGINEVLRRQGLMSTRLCLDPNEDLSPGQAEELDRVCAAYPHLIDDSFVEEHRDAWLR
jgi:hypothetical protein